MENWSGLIREAVSRRPAPIRAVSFFKCWTSASRPALFRCDDGRERVVKGRQAGRMVVTDQVLGFLGNRLGGPIPEVSIVEVPQLLIDNEPQIAHFQAGASHGSAYVLDCTERENDIAYVSDGVNPSRFAFLAVFYGWVQASDHQFIYGNTAPHAVHSVDHGHFLPGGPNWTLASLSSAAAAGLDSKLERACTPTQQELAVALQALSDATDELIAEAVARVPSCWGLSVLERIGLARFLAHRRDVMISTFTPRP